MQTTPSDLERCFRAKKEIIDEIPGLFRVTTPNHTPLSEVEKTAISTALKNSGVESAESRLRVDNAYWLYEFLNLMVYCNSYPEGDEPEDLRFVPPTQAKYITCGDMDGDYVLQHRKEDGWCDFDSHEKLDIPPEAKIFNFDWLPPGCYRLKEK